MTARELIDDMRRRDLLARYGIWPDEIADKSIAGREHMIRRLIVVCANLRDDGLNRHWAYSPAEHRSVLSLLEKERADLAALTEKELA